MSKALIIAEKPSVAADIARALGGFAKHDEYFGDTEVYYEVLEGSLPIAGPRGLGGSRGPTGTG